MIDLDDPALGAADRSDALGVLARSAEQWSEGVARARALDGIPDPKGITSLVYCGMGGSGIAGDALAAVAAPVARAPVLVVKGYALPAFVGRDTLVVCASYSGDTEETLACFDQALHHHARVVVVATGGELAERAIRARLPWVAPSAGHKPRMAFTSMVAETLVLAERAGVLPDLSADLDEARAVIDGRARALAPGRTQGDNEAKGLAVALGRLVPLVWGQEGVLAVAAQRWRTQLNENAKVPAFASVVPELDHNEVVGYDPGLPALEQVAIVVLRAPGEDPRVARRIAATIDGVRARVGAVLEAATLGESPLARLMGSVLLGDFASVYLALRYGIDPTPIEAIEALKRRLA